MPEGARPDGNKQKWIEKVGSWKYYALILANFDPVRADAIWDTPAEEIAVSFVSMLCYNHKPDGAR